MKPPAAHLVATTLLLLAATAAQSADGGSCEALSAAAPAHTTVTAQSVPAGSFTPPYGNALDKLPAFCRLAGVAKPTADSYIRFEVWMPASGWNGRFLAAGNGGYAGAIDFNSLGRNLRRGYATAATDTGHEGEAVDASWAFHHPEKITDFGYRGLHETVASAKAFIRAFYSQPAQHSYFDACSDGGREALMEAQRFPEDFDGILAGAPANNWTHMLAGGIDLLQNSYGHTPASYISAVKLPAINAAALAACDAQDGVKDGVINDPSRCHFDPSVLLCKDVETRNCLTAPQVTSLKNLYAGSKLFPGLVPGAEPGGNGWSTWVLGAGPGGSSGAMYMENYFRYMVFDDPTWNALTANVEAAARAADQKTAQALNATDPDLRKFQARGGKLLIYHGWNDPGISPWNTVNYYQSVVSTMGASAADSFVRLYMVPGMQHCAGGPGAAAFGQLGITTAKGPEYGIYAALEQWVEAGTAPSEIVATKYIGDNSARGVQMTRKLCPYPQVASYKGAGDTNDFANYTCTAPGETHAAAGKPVLYLIGDSTVRNGQGDGANGQWGWGEPIAAYFDPAKIAVLNRALGGRSSRTFLTEGRWDKVLETLKPGDIVMMQFGHNDGGPLDDTARARGTLPGVGDETKEIDNPITKQHEVVHTFGWYMKKFVEDTRAKGAVPIVCSLIPRKIWKDGKIERNSDTYQKWAAEVAASGQAPFVDLNEIIARRYDALGPEKVEPLFADPHTHTSMAGAELNAESVISGLKGLANDPLAPYFSDKAQAVEPFRPAGTGIVSRR